jgi:putative copper export protein
VTATPLTYWLFIDKAALYGAVLLSIGVGLHNWLGVTDNLRRAKAIVLCGGLSSVVLVLARLVLTSAQIGDPETALAASNLSLAWLTQGASVISLALGTILAAISASLNARWLHLASAGLLAASFALTGHAQGVTNPLLTPIAAFAHVLIAGFWFVAPLTLWPSPTSETLAVRLERFSTTAIIAIPILFVLGVALLLRIAGSPTAAFTTTYGFLLLGKLAAATCALALGGYNKLVVSSAIRNGEARAQAHLKTTLVCEGLLFSVALLLLATATTFSGPDAG